MDRTLPISYLIHKLETDYFESNWLRSSDTRITEAQKTLWVNNIINASTEIFKYYILLFLSGEYCFLVENDKAESEIESLEKTLEKISDSIEVEDDQDIQLELQSRFADNILYPLINIIKPTIIYFIRDLSIQFEIEYKRNLFRGDRAENNQRDVDVQVLAYSNAFRHVLKLTNVEHMHYHQSESVVRHLLLLGKEIELFAIDEELKKPISVKVNFLLRKLLYRLRHSNSGNEAELIYSFDQQADEELSVHNIAIDDKLLEWDNLINTHYGFNLNYKTEQRKRAQSIYVKDESDYCYNDFHGLIKIYKDDTRNNEQTSNLLSVFKKRKPLSSTKIDQYAKKVTQAYLFNNNISLKCENKKLTFDECNSLYEEIRNQQNTDNLRNYFSWEKLAQTIGAKIDKLLDDLVDKEKYTQFKVLLELYSKAVGKFEETLKWSKNKSFLPIQMPFKECQSDYEIKISDSQTIRLFFFSSFLLPLDFNSIGKSGEMLRSRKLKYDTLSAVYDKLQHVVEDVNESSEKMRKQERRSVEILAIFAAVALFSMGSIQIFSNQAVASDPHVYYRFIMAFGYSLALFVLLIWIITRDDIKRVHVFHWIIVGLVFISSCIAIGYFVGDPLFSIITGNPN